MYLPCEIVDLKGRLRLKPLQEEIIIMLNDKDLFIFI